MTAEVEGEQQYCLRWNNHSDSIISEFEVLLGQEDFVDVTLSCDKQALKAHKVVLSACSSYFRRLLKDNPCQHPIIILRDVGYQELRSILYFMYHGQVMVDQERIPQLLQTAQLLEVRGLCEIQNKDGDTVTDTNNRKSFLAGLLNTSKKRSSSIISAESNSSPPPSTSNKRQKTSSSSASNSARPVPMLQSILSQQLAVPNTPTFDLGVGRSTRALSALASKVQSNKSGAALPTSLENLLSGSSSVNNNGGPDIHSTASSCSSDDGRDRLIIVGETSSASFGELLDRTGSSRGEDLDGETVVEIKEEPIIHYLEDEFCDEEENGINEGSDEAEMSENSHGEVYTLPLLAQHLATPSSAASASLLSASAKLRAAASQARHLSGGSAISDGGPLIAAIMAPSSPMSDTGPPSVNADGSFDPLGSDPPRKLAFHEPRPCPICRRMYRDAATLRTHTAIMHAEGRDPFACLCGELFRTKYEMYNHKKNGHR